jgi:hypothetical protein
VSDGNPFASFIRRIRAGDEEAAAELVRHFEPGGGRVSGTVSPFFIGKRLLTPSHPPI